MGFFEDIEEFLDNIGEDADEITIDIVTNKEDLDKKIKELEDDGYTLAGEKTCRVTLDDIRSNEDEEDEDEAIETLRLQAKKQREEMVEKLGVEKTNKIIRLSALCAMITNLMTNNVPLDQDMVDEYNSLCRDLHPELADEFTCKLFYMIARHTAEKASKSLE